MVPIVAVSCLDLDLFYRTIEGFPADVTGCCATGRPVWNFHAVSTVVGRPARDEFRSRRFNTRRDTSVVESLDTNHEYVIISTPVLGSNTLVSVVVDVLSNG